MNVKMIAAVDNRWCIGNDNELLFHDPDDLKYFKKVTDGSIVVMGRKTWDSLPKKPLPNRKNIVITNDEYLLSRISENGCWYFKLDDVKSLIDITSDNDLTMFIIGGESIYKAFEPYVNEVYINKFHEKRPGNKFIKNYDLDDSFEKVIIESDYENFDTFVYRRVSDIPKKIKIDPVLEKALQEVKWQNVSVDLSLEAIETLRDFVDWEEISRHKLLPIDFIERNSDKIDFKLLSYNMYIPMYSSFLLLQIIEKFGDKLDWDSISCNIGEFFIYNTTINVEILEKYRDRINWKLLLHHMNPKYITEYFIRTFQDYIDWDSIFYSVEAYGYSSGPVHNSVSYNIKKLYEKYNKEEK